MAGVMYLGNQMVSPVIVQGGGEPEPFPVRGLKAELGSDGFIDKYSVMSYTELYKDYKDAPFYFDGKKIKAMEIIYQQILDTKSYPIFAYAFKNSSIEYIDFSDLSHLPAKREGLPGRDHPLREMIANTDGVHIYFRALTTQTNYVPNVFQPICKNATNAVVHFPSNLESIVSGLTGYPNFGGTNTTIAFDLPATS